MKRNITTLINTLLHSDECDMKAATKRERKKVRKKRQRERETEKQRKEEREKIGRAHV